MASMENLLLFQIFVVYLFVYESYLKQTPLNWTFMISVFVHCVATFIEFHLLNVVCLSAMQSYEIGGEQISLNGSLLPKLYQRIVSLIEKILHCMTGKFKFWALFSHIDIELHVFASCKRPSADFHRTWTIPLG